MTAFSEEKVNYPNSGLREWQQPIFLLKILQIIDYIDQPVFLSSCCLMLHIKKIHNLFVATINWNCRKQDKAIFVIAKTFWR